MEPTSLSDSQRESLKAQLIHRIQKLPDEALLQLEAITRHPQTISGFTSQVKEPAMTIIPRPAHNIEKTQPRRITIINSESREITRREALAYGAGGFMLLLAGLNGAGWLNASNQTRNLRKDITDLGAPAWSYQLQANCAQMTARLTTLQQLSANESVLKKEHDALVIKYQHEHMLALDAFDQLQRDAAHMRELHDALSLDEILKHLSLFVATKNPLQIGEFFVSAYNQMETLIEFLQSTPFLLRSGEGLLGKLASWFDQAQGINSSLFEPLHSDLFPALDQVSEQASAAKQNWEGDLALKISEMLDTWKRLNETVGKI